MAYPRSGSIPAVIESGRVLDVDLGSYTLSVTTQFTKKPQSGIPFATPYQHFANGEGIYFMPEVGSLCWVCFPSDGMRPFVIAWASGGVEGDHRANKKDLNPGDIYLGTRDENFLILRRGGVVQVGGGPLNQRIFLPVNNTIKDFCENYHLNSLAGDFEWTVARTEETTDGKRPASVKLKAREFADDANPIAELEIGSHGENEPTILSLNIRASGADSSDRKLVLSIDKTGNITWTAHKNSIWAISGKGSFAVDVEGDAAIVSKGEAGISGKTLVARGNDSAEVTTNGALALKGQREVSVDGARVVVNGGLFPVLIASPTMLAWFAFHTHLITSPGAPSGPPLPVLTGDQISKSLFAK